MLAIDNTNLWNEETEKRDISLRKVRNYGIVIFIFVVRQFANI